MEVKSILITTFILSFVWKTECYNLEHRGHNKHDNRTVVRLKRQTLGQPCNGDNTKFQCTTTRDCIDSELECDGKEDCQDGSDEKESLCKDLPCPKYLFKCDYGACIGSDERCNGKKNCNDNSDEVGCEVFNKVNSNCRSDQFECFNGQCLEIDIKCNGTAECEDKSDETEELCFNLFCPGYTFKCKYGACVDGDAECDKIQNCIDNSDEDEKKCSRPSLTIPVPVSVGKKCVTPAQLDHGKWSYLSDSRKADANVRVDAYTVIAFSCEPGYKLSTTRDASLPAVCLETGDWSLRVLPICKKLCKSLYNTPLLTVSCKNDGSLVPCDKATDNTILTHKCAPYYEPLHGMARSSTCYDGTWDYTPNCIPVCGEKRVTASPLIVNGVAVERGDYPWVVALYSSIDSDPYYTNICGGSLITTEIVLTAAHCVAKNTGKVYPASYFRVAAGKYFNRYEDDRDRDTAQYAEVTQIETHKEYKGELGNYRGDIALLKLKTPLALSKVVQPVCYHNLPALDPNTVGLVTGWGYTTSSGKPSDILRELEMPYNENKQCLLDEDFAERYLTSDKFCAGFSNENTSVCKGDSGGGLVFRDTYYKSRYSIYGIVSLGHSYTANSANSTSQIHCNIERSALFTKVETYLEWIQLKVRQWTHM